MHNQRLKEIQGFQCFYLRTIILKTVQFTCLHYVHGFYHLIIARIATSKSHRTGRTFYKYYTCFRFQWYKRKESRRKLEENENRRQMYSDRQRSHGKDVKTYYEHNISLSVLELLIYSLYFPKSFVSL